MPCLPRDQGLVLVVTCTLVLKGLQSAVRVLTQDLEKVSRVKKIQERAESSSLCC
jgi:hypothetical protein